MTPPEDNPPNVPPRVALHARSESGKVLWFDGGPVDTSRMPASHNGPTPTTRMVTDCGEFRVRDCVCGNCESLRPEALPLRNTKLTRPAEQYPGEAERMIDTWTKEAVAAIQRARDATTGPRLVSELEAAEHAIKEALRWSKP